MTARIGAPGGQLDAVCVVFQEIDTPIGRSAIDKRPVPGPVAVKALGLAGDYVIDTVHHGGYHQAVYAYAEEEAQRWADELERPLPAGWFGENFRVSGVAVTDAVVGTRWHIGEAVFEVTAPRIPCAKFQHKAEEKRWVKRFTQRADVGTYLRVVQEGTVTAGDAIEVVGVPDHGVTIRDKFFERIGR